MKFIAKNNNDVAKALSVASSDDIVAINSDPGKPIHISNINLKHVVLHVENNSIVYINGYSMGKVLVKDRATLISDSDAFIISINKSIVIANGIERIAGSGGSIIQVNNRRNDVVLLANAYAYARRVDQTISLNDSTAREIVYCNTIEQFLEHWSPEPDTYRDRDGYIFYKLVSKYEGAAFRYDIVGDTVANYSTYGEHIVSKDGAPAFALSPEVSHAKLAARRNGLDTVVVRCFVPNTANMSIIVDNSGNIVPDTILVSEFVVH